MACAVILILSSQEIISMNANVFALILGKVGQQKIENSLICLGRECTIDKCTDIDCGNGVCVAGTCSCNPAYLNINNFCKATCATDPCQALDFTTRF